MSSFSFGVVDVESGDGVVGGDSRARVDRGVDADVATTFGVEETGVVLATDCVGVAVVGGGSEGILVKLPGGGRLIALPGSVCGLFPHRARTRSPFCALSSKEPGPISTNIHDSCILLSMMERIPRQFPEHVLPSPKSLTLQPCMGVL